MILEPFSKLQEHPTLFSNAAVNVSKLTNVDFDQISLVVNIDSLPLFKSSKVKVWPILGKIFNFGNPFIIAMFCGTKKPISEFLKEVDFLVKNGVNIDGKQITFELKFFICDTLARQFLK